MPTRAEKIAGGVWGALVGDALGVPYEFHAPETLPPLPEIEMTPPPGFSRAHSGVPVGTWSDDGAQLLALLASLLESGEMHIHDFGQRLLAWYDEAEYSADGVVFDIGIQTGDALRHLRRGVSAMESGSTSERANGNGSLMRVLPLALWHRGSDEELARDAMLQSVVTHGHVRSQLCCALYCLWARHELNEHADAWNAAALSLRAIFPEGSAQRDELENHIRPDSMERGGGSGYVVDCLRSAHQVAQNPDYESTVKAAIALGHDTDTTACVAGGIAGIRGGVQSIPARWLDAMQGKPIAQPLIDELVERAR